MQRIPILISHDHPVFKQSGIIYPINYIILQIKSQYFQHRQNHVNWFFNIENIITLCYHPQFDPIPKHSLFQHFFKDQITPLKSSAHEFSVRKIQSNRTVRKESVRFKMNDIYNYYRLSRGKKWPAASHCYPPLGIPAPVLNSKKAKEFYFS